MKRIPTISDFPTHLTVIITLPQNQSSYSQQQPPSNILILLHGLGDNSTRFSSFGKALNLPETICITVQAPTPLPDLFALDSTTNDGNSSQNQGFFHWGDDIIFDSSSGGDLDIDAGFERSAKSVLAQHIIRNVLVEKCGYRLREILLLGYGQGGMAGLVAARNVGCRFQTTNKDTNQQEEEEVGALSGVISIGAAYPVSDKQTSRSDGGKNQSPVLILAARPGSSAVTDTAMTRTRDLFEFVEVHRWNNRRDDGMPRNREEMMPLMQFLARRLRSRAGVPEGSVELT
jgi:pimeloyl-ACP methyl ester carboxylesterase